MQDGFIKAAVMTPKVRVADPYYNADRIMEMMDDAETAGAKIVVFPELCITGYTCEDLFFQESLLTSAREALLQIIAHSDGMDAVFFVGLPLEHRNKLYNVAAVINCGELMGFVPKVNLPMYGEFYEGRHFESGMKQPVMTEFDGEDYPLGTDMIFESDAMQGLGIAVEICEDLWAPEPPSVKHALNGATVIVNLSASNEVVGKRDYRRMLIRSVSAKLCCAYLYAGAGYGESTQDLVFCGHDLIAENGTILAESTGYTNGAVYADLDIERIRAQRRRMTSFATEKNSDYLLVGCTLIRQETEIDRQFARKPFVPDDPSKRQQRCKEIFAIQALGLAKRMEHTGCKTPVIGLSGGLDSTLALLVVAKAMDICDLPRKNILAVTMPGFGTTDRTKDNAVKLADRLGAELMDIDITKAVMQHFADIGQDPDNHDVTYENAQARERTQILMDLANQKNGMVIGTGDLSELALGWATYNGDHMSMYGVNGSIPKTLVRHLVRFYADTCGDEGLCGVLLDILDTPVSPELLPPKDGVISQRTEDLVGPYTLHDFFLYYMMRWGFSPRKIFRLACQAFICPEQEEQEEGKEYFDAETIFKWLTVFCRRFFSQQFKRSCLPDGPKVGSVTLSPRGDLRMPSDATSRVWLRELEDLGDELKGLSEEA
ncbi:MAG: NAD(+) synthase [Lachnospiraceae bacterium]|nr:NAD(+) synthase [Lachnospiraceae bacterium]